MHAYFIISDVRLSVCVLVLTTDTTESLSEDEDEMLRHHPVVSWRGSYQKPAIHVISPAAHARIELPSQDKNSNKDRFLSRSSSSSSSSSSSTTTTTTTAEDDLSAADRDDDDDDGGGVRVNVELRVTGDYRLQSQDLLVLHVDDLEMVLRIPVLDFLAGEYHVLVNDPGSHSFSARLQSEQGVVIAQTTVTFEVVPFPTQPAIPRQEVRVQAPVFWFSYLFRFPLPFFFSVCECRSRVVLMLMCVCVCVCVSCPTYGAFVVCVSFPWQPWEWEDDITQESLQMWTSHFDVVKILFIIDTTTIDGYKMNVVNQIKQLDSNRFHLTMLDLSCRSGNPISEKPFLRLLIENGMQHHMVEVIVERTLTLTLKP
jgi:hypothetical protein